MARKPSSNKAVASLVPSSAGPAAMPPARYLTSGNAGYGYEDYADAANDDGEAGQSDTRSDANGEDGDDTARSAMAERIWARLNLRADLELAHIQIRMERDTVRVTGRVATDAARRRIADCVTACAGVRVVRNGIRLAC